MTENSYFFLNYNTIGEYIIDSYNYFQNKNYYIDKNKISDTISSFVYKLNYKKGQSRFTLIYKALNSIDKSENWKYSNILYEFYVGKSINIIKEYLPNFVYTFGIDLAMCPYDPIVGDKLILNNIKTDFDDFGLIENGCLFDKHNGLLTEYLSNSKTFLSMLSDEEFMNLAYIDYNLFSTLFQLYAALYSLRDIYTHQDLHLKNVMIITLPNPLNIIYNIDDVEYILITKYIPVIIDYSSNYINFDQQYNSCIYLNKACETRCNNPGYDGKCNLIKHGLNNSTPDSYDPSSKYGKRYGKSLFNLNRSIDIYFIGKLMYEYEEETKSQYIPEDIPLNIRFRELFNKYTYNDWFITNMPNRVITSLLAEYSPPLEGDKCPQYIRYTSDVLTKFLIPYYYENYVKIKDFSLSTINIDTNARTKWTTSKSNPAEFLRNLKEKPEPVYNTETFKTVSLSVSTDPVGAENRSFRKLVVAKGRFEYNIDEFRRILMIIEMKPNNLEGRRIDSVLLVLIVLFNNIRSKDKITIRDIHQLNRIFYKAPEESLTMNNTPITKERIYKIMNDLFNYSAAVSVPGRFGGYYEKYKKYKAKYLRLKALGI